MPHHPFMGGEALALMPGCPTTGVLDVPPAPR
jgi:hypothetical protein